MYFARHKLQRPHRPFQIPHTDSNHSAIMCRRSVALCYSPLMERPVQVDDKATQRRAATPPPAAPTTRDHENARIRREIAEKQEAEYAECMAMALKAFGPDWLPSHRHYLVDIVEAERVRYTSERPRAAATVYSVRNAAGEARHFTVRDDGQITEHASYKEGFGSMLLEPHPTHGFEHGGRWCPFHRYNLCFAPYDLYSPKTAEQLAALRVSREKRKAEREYKKWAEENPLFATLEEKE